MTRKKYEHLLIMPGYYPWYGNGIKCKNEDIIEIEVATDY
jgi:hypothetical protein